MNDLISKEVVIDTLKAVRDLVWEVDIPSPTVPEYIEHHEQMQSIMRNIDILTDKIIKMPSVQPESAELSGKVWDEWCTGCKEYDQERHCCPRFNRVIRTTLDDAQPERIRGRWEHRSRKIAPHNTIWWYACSVCGGGGSITDFCPNCGADMRETDE